MGESPHEHRLPLALRRPLLQVVYEEVDVRTAPLDRLGDEVGVVVEARDLKPELVEAIGPEARPAGHVEQRPRLERELLHVLALDPRPECLRALLVALKRLREGHAARPYNCRTPLIVSGE